VTNYDLRIKCELVFFYDFLRNYDLIISCRVITFHNFTTKFNFWFKP